MASKGGSLDKTEAIKTHVVGLGAADEAYLTVKLLMPGKANDPRAYQLKDKSLIGTLSTALRCSEREMLSTTRARPTSASRPSTSTAAPS